MCFMQSTPKPIAPAPPPPPPPTLDQAAPDTAVATDSANSKRKAAGSKKYRTNDVTGLNIAAPPSGGTGTGLGIS